MRNGLAFLFTFSFIIAGLASCSTAGVEQVSDRNKSSAQKNSNTVAESKKPMPALRDSVPRAGKVWVVKPDGSKSCGMKKGIPLKQAVEELEGTGVKVLKAKNGHDGKLHMMVCGADTGNRIEVLIDNQSVSTAAEKGFKVKGED